MERAVKRRMNWPRYRASARISSASTLATMNQGEPGTGRISANTSTPRLSRPSNAPVLPRAAWTQSNVGLRQRNAQGQRRVGPVAELVQKQDVIAVPAYQQRLRAAARRGPRLDKGVEELLRIRPQDQHGYRAVVRVEDRSRHVQMHLVADRAAKKIAKHRVARRDRLRDQLLRMGIENGQAGIEREAECGRPGRQESCSRRSSKSRNVRRRLRIAAFNEALIAALEPLDNVALDDAR